MYSLSEALSRSQSASSLATPAEGKKDKFPEFRLWATWHPESSLVYSEGHANAGCNAVGEIVKFVNGTAGKEHRQPPGTPQS